jgi:hypothetical protein
VIAGIVVGSVVGVAVLAGLTGFYVMKKRRVQNKNIIKRATKDFGVVPWDEEEDRQRLSTAVPSAPQGLASGNPAYKDRDNRTATVAKVTMPAAFDARAAADVNTDGKAAFRAARKGATRPPQAVGGAVTRPLLVPSTSESPTRQQNAWTRSAVSVELGPPPSPILKEDPAATLEPLMVDAPSDDSLSRLKGIHNRQGSPNLAATPTHRRSKLGTASAVVLQLSDIHQAPAAPPGSVLPEGYQVVDLNSTATVDHFGEVPSELRGSKSGAVTPSSSSF